MRTLREITGDRWTGWSPGRIRNLYRALSLLAVVGFVFHGSGGGSRPALVFLTQTVSRAAVMVLASFAGHSTVVTFGQYLLSLYFPTEAMAQATELKNAQTCMVAALEEKERLVAMQEAGVSDGKAQVHGLTSAVSSLGSKLHSVFRSPWNEERNFSKRDSHSVVVDLTVLRQEIESLRKMEHYLALQSQEIAERMELVRMRQSWAGRVQLGICLVIGIIGILKVLASSITLLIGSYTMATSEAPVLRILRILSLWSESDYGSTLSLSKINVASFAFLLLLLATSFRSVLLSILKFLTWHMSFLRPSSIVLLISEFLGLYCLGTVILSRSAIPEHHRFFLERAFGNHTQYAEYYRLFDIFFVLSAVISSILNGIHINEHVSTSM